MDSLSQMMRWEKIKAHKKLKNIYLTIIFSAIFITTIVIIFITIALSSFCCQIDEMMTIADLDGDGKMEYSEFCKLMEALVPVIKEKPGRKVKWR